jgi:hypothetical protein
MRKGDKGIKPVKTKIIGFYALRSNDFPCKQLLAIQVADAKEQKCVDHNFVADIHGRILCHHRTAARLRTFCSNLRRMTDAEVGFPATCAPGIVSACENLYFSAAKGGTFRLIEVLHSNALLNPAGLKPNREKISLFYRGVPDVNIGAF